MRTTPDLDRRSRLTIDPTGADIPRTLPFQTLALEFEPVPAVHFGIGDDGLDGRDIFRQVHISVEFDLGPVQLERADGGIGVAAIPQSSIPEDRVFIGEPADRSAGTGQQYVLPYSMFKGDDSALATFLERSVDGWRVIRISSQSLDGASFPLARRRYRGGGRGRRFGDGRGCRFRDGRSDRSG